MGVCIRPAAHGRSQFLLAMCRWVKAGNLTQRTEPLVEGVRVRRVYSPDRDEAQRLSEALRIERVCNSVAETIGGADGVLVLDRLLR